MWIEAEDGELVNTDALSRIKVGSGMATGLFAIKGFVSADGELLTLSHWTTREEAQAKFTTICAGICSGALLVSLK